MNHPKIKIGLMGCGTVANYGHLPAISAVPQLQLASLFDPNEQSLESAREKFNVPFATTDMESFFKSDIDAVAITSPAPAHLGNVLAAAKHGKPVLCEKPLAMDPAEGRRMIDAMKQAKLPFFVGFTYRFSPAAMTIREMVQSHAIGKVLDLRLIYLWDLHGKFVYADDGTRSLSQRRVGRMLEGGPMVDCGVHQIDLERVLNYCTEIAVQLGWQGSLTQVMCQIRNGILCCRI
jgi:predicted dehydrogenase